VDRPRPPSLIRTDASGRHRRQCDCARQRRWGETCNVTEAPAVGDWHDGNFSPLLLRCFCRATCVGTLQGQSL